MDSPVLTVSKSPGALRNTGKSGDRRVLKKGYLNSKGESWDNPEHLHCPKPPTRDAAVFSNCQHLRTFLGNCRSFKPSYKTFLTNHATIKKKFMREINVFSDMTDAL
jgi:hypothetical protein